MGCHSFQLPPAWGAGIHSRPCGPSAELTVALGTRGGRDAPWMLRCEVHVTPWCPRKWLWFPSGCSAQLFPPSVRRPQPQLPSLPWSAPVLLGQAARLALKHRRGPVGSERVVRTGPGSQRCFPTALTRGSVWPLPWASCCSAGDEGSEKSCRKGLVGGYLSLLSPPAPHPHPACPPQSLPNRPLPPGARGWQSRGSPPPYPSWPRCLK